MLQFIPVYEDNTLAIRASEKLSHEDYQAFLPKLETQIKRIGKVSLLLELDNFHGWDLEAAKDDFTFGMKHLGDLERIAIVGDKSWEHWMAVMAKPFMLNSEVRYFDRENLQDAWDWLREKQSMEAAATELLPYKKILVPVDFSLYSKHATKRAIELAKFYKAKLSLVHIIQEISQYPAYYADSMLGYGYSLNSTQTTEQNEEQLKMAQAQMKAFVRGLDADLDFDINTDVSRGEVKETLLSHIEAQRADLVIFGVEKKKGLNKLLGSTPHFIQNHARSEVLTVPLLQDASTFA